MRVRYLPISMDFFLRMIKNKGEIHAKCVNPLPADAQIVRVGYDETATLNLIIESAEFEDIDDGDMPPLQEKVLFEALVGDY